MMEKSRVSFRKIIDGTLFNAEPEKCSGKSAD